MLVVLALLLLLRSGTEATPMFPALAAMPATAAAILPVAMPTAFACMVSPPPPAVRALLGGRRRGAGSSDEI